MLQIISKSTFTSIRLNVKPMGASDTGNFRLFEMRTMGRRSMQFYLQLEIGAFHHRMMLGIVYLIFIKTQFLLK